MLDCLFTYPSYIIRCVLKLLIVMCSSLTVIVERESLCEFDPFQGSAKLAALCLFECCKILFDQHIHIIEDSTVRSTDDMGLIDTKSISFSFIWTWHWQMIINSFDGSLISYDFVSNLPFWVDSLIFSVCGRAAVAFGYSKPDRIRSCELYYNCRAIDCMSMFKDSLNFQQTKESLQWYLL